MNISDEEKEKRKSYHKAYRKKNKESLKIKNSIRNKIHYEVNKEETQLKHKTWRENNRQKARDYSSQYYKDNRQKVNSYMNSYIKNKRHADPLFKIRTNLGSRFNYFLKEKGIRKQAKTIELIGCTIPFLKDYLEGLFLPTMTWENYGKYWHIDHIKPCHLFNLLKKEEQLKCFHYTNLQPLFAVTQVIDGVEYIGNINKSNKYDL